MKKFLIVVLFSLVAACSNVTKDDLGLARKSPNERLVEQRDVLSIPPEFGLRPVEDMQ
ncbi:MAG: DUF3035 domain-containing protein [Alphaproteobacteria bacterium]|nr:DUF3035 domain-containing protein [Alphaproteobacteria bacterium]